MLVIQKKPQNTHLLIFHNTQYFDLDGDGHITRAELEQVLASKGDLGDAADIIKAVDQDGDGTVDYAEVMG